MSHQIEGTERSAALPHDTQKWANSNSGQTIQLFNVPL